MTLVAEFTIPPEALPFGQTLVENPDVRIEVERIVPSGESALPFCWVWGEDPERFAAAAEGESEITDTTRLDAVDGGALYRTEWSPDATLVEALTGLDATVLECEGTAEHWRVELRGVDRDSLVEFRELFEADGVSVTLSRLYDLGELVEGDRQTLTPQQREALIAAYREGYYDKPRAVTQEELGERFGISHRAVSERLRRGVRNLVAASLLPDPDT